MNTDQVNTDKGGCSDELSERVIGAIYEVANTLGAGFLEKVYERALVRELEMRGVKAVGQASMPVVYKGRAVGDYFADILVEDRLVVELKCVERLSIHSEKSAFIRLDRRSSHGEFPTSRLR